MSEIEQLRAELSRLQGRLDELEQVRSDQPVPRRNMLRALGGVAAGAAVGGLAFAKPTQALDGGNVVIGNTTQTAQSPTRIAASSFTEGQDIGIFGTSDSNTPFSIFPAANQAQIRNAVQSSGLTGTMVADGGTGVTGTGASGMQAFGTAVGISAVGPIGAKLIGDTPLKLYDSGDDPNTTSALGGVFRFHSGTLYFGVGVGSDEWRRLASAGSAGVFVPVTPFRVYDSRTFVNPSNDGPLAAGANRTIDCSDAIDVEDGTVTDTDALPSDARAIAYTITATGTVGGGYLAVTPASATSVTASTINWDSPVTVANSSLVAVTNRSVKVFCGGGPGTSAEFIIDVVGYYH